MTEDEMVEWCHQLNGHEFEQALGVGDGQGGHKKQKHTLPTKVHLVKAMVFK